MKHILLFFLAGIFFSTSGFAQKIDREKALQEYKNMGYMAFANHYQKAENVAPEIAEMLGNSYKLNGNPEAAAYWYARALESQAKADLILNYAHALLGSGNCEEAVKWYQKYQEETSSDQEAMETFIQNCGAIRASKIFGDVEITQVAGLNTEYLDFSPVPVENGMVFTSSRKLYNPVQHNDKWTLEEFTDLYFAPLQSDGTFGAPEPLFGSVNRKYHDGVATFVGSNKQMFFTRNNYEKKRKNNVLNLKIYRAVLENNYWKPVEELPFNGEEFNTCHPTLSSDGRLMVFSSDRPGGTGGMDLYFSTWKNQQWSAPASLGEIINTSGNEIFPFLDRKGRLFYASNGRAGLGGLDLFVCEYLGDNKWGEPQNLGESMNSEKDDFGIFVQPDGKRGYFSSNRAGGTGKDDIYEWKSVDADFFTPEKPVALAKPAEVSIIVVDAATQQPIQGAKIGWAEMTLPSGLILKEDTWVTVPPTNLELSAFPGRTFVFNVEKPGYEPKRISVNSETLKSSPKGYLLPLDKIKTITMNGMVVDAVQGTSIPKASVEVTNQCDGTTTTYMADNTGHFHFETSCGCTYTMVTRHNGYLLSRKEFLSDCQTTNVQVAMASSNNNIIPDIPNLGEADLKEGAVITLKNLYYDFDKWNIRSDASVELDKVVQLLNQYPDMEIELGSHTDSRGKDSYNMDLSQKRAESAVEYIISKGIRSGRIRAKGYGESQLVNRCANGVNCTDTEHQENRRTEIRITKFPKSDVRVIYENDR